MAALAVVTVLALGLGASPAAAGTPVTSTGSALSKVGGVTKRIALSIPTKSTGDASTTDVVVMCFAEITEPFIGPGLRVYTHINVYCERAIYMIYAEVIMFWNGQPYQPSFARGQIFGSDHINVVSFGTPCVTGSVYQGFAYVEVFNPGGGDSAEIVTDTLLRC